MDYTFAENNKEGLLTGTTIQKRKIKLLLAKSATALYQDGASCSFNSIAEITAYNTNQNINQN